MQRMKFGIFHAPFHDHATNPNANLHRDLELIRHLDYLGFDEAWIGEHHSCGTEIIADPMIFCATALERTRSHKASVPGCCSVPYHNPLWTADRIVQLDHLSRGRFMFGAGPGALPTDAYMIGIQPSEQRRMLEEGMEAIMHLLYRGRAAHDGDRLVQPAGRQVPAAPASPSELDIVVAAIASPSGPRIAGKHGIGLLSIGATMQAGADVLALHYDVWKDRCRPSSDNEADRNKLAPRRCHAPGRDQGTGHARRRVRDRALVRLPPAHRGRPPVLPGGRHTAGADRVGQRDRHRRHRHRGGLRQARSSRCGSSPVASAATCAWTTTLPTRRPRHAATNCWPSG